MAVNLRKGLVPEYTLLICDVNQDARARFRKQMEGKGPVGVVENGLPFECRFLATLREQKKKRYLMRPSADYVRTEDGNSHASQLSRRKSSLTPALHRPNSRRHLSFPSIIHASTQDPYGMRYYRNSYYPLDRFLCLLSNLSSGTLTFIDAPVSGGPMGAEDGTLTFVVGANQKAEFETVNEVLCHMGKHDSIFHCGAVGSGTAFKIISNYLSAVTSLAASEALNIVAKMGLDLKLLTDVINVSGGQCWVSSKSNPVPGLVKGVPSSRDYEGGSRIELCEKVLRMGSQLAKEVGARTVLDGPALRVFGESMGDERYRGRDVRVVHKWMNESERK